MQPCTVFLGTRWSLQKIFQLGKYESVSQHLGVTVYTPTRTHCWLSHLRGWRKWGRWAGSSVLMCLHSELDACLLPVAVTTYAFLLSTWSKAFRNSESSSYEHSGPQTDAIRTSIEARGGAVYAWHRGRALEHEEKQSQLLSNHGIYANLQPLAIWEFSFQT